MIIWGALGVLVGVTCLTGSPLSAQAGDVGAVVAATALDPERDRAVRLAREGAFDEALEILLALHAATPEDIGLRGDLAAVLSWSGRDAEALELGGHLPFHSLPPIVSEAVARSARNLDHPSFAAGLYRDVLDRAPERVESQIGYALSLVEAAQPSRALERLPILRALSAEHPQAGVAAGHVLAASERWTEAALEYRMVGIRPEPLSEAFSHESMSLRVLGADHLAVDAMRRSPSPFPAELHADLLAGRAARTVEWGSSVPERRGPSDRFLATDHALATVDAALEEIAHLPGSEVDFPSLRLRFDRLVALRERERMVEVRQGVRQLEAEGVELPPYVQRVAADAELALRNPTDAVVRYRIALEGWPGHPETTLGLFYALVEEHRFREADELLATFIAQQPTRRRSDGMNEPISNPDLLPAVVARHLGFAFSGQLARAEAGLADLHARAPMNADIRQELASVRLWRGWPRDADALYRRTLAVDPERVGARVGRASAALATHERATARAVVDTLLWLAPESEHVRRVAQDLRVDGSWAYSSRAESGRSTGGDLGTRDRILETRLVSPPIADRVRLVAGARRADARYPEGLGAHDRAFAGLTLSSRPIVAELTGHGDREGALNPGVSARLELRPDDRWTLELFGDSRTTEVPLRAAREAINGWMLRLGVSRRSHEARQWSAQAAHLEMQDGNRRHSAYFNIEQQVARTPGHRFALMTEGYGATNSRDDAPYFNPRRTLSASGSLLWDWTLMERRERSYAQRVSLTGGAMDQADFDLRPILSAAVEHRWVMHQRFELVYGASWSLPVYDGVRERRTAGHLGVTWRIP
ncbi:MAG: poly-beta-1,6 N-acetyl-D-glucosamine export porin PgaA [Gemmatimonadales bacterium]|nr:MAG: poly-beta-1,6 N-acetyl-D-glucosamine export porin PgaA [Gemmatimonadales bacterium]